MRDLAAGPRVLLRRLRELMAEALEPQERLDRIVREIAQNMVAEVCSLYVLRSDSVLELYATEGLNPGSVHLAQLKLGQGLVGTIAASARPLNLSDAQTHPAFAYLPETGEEIYNSFLGVPVLRAGRTLGVLVVQNRTKRHYRDDEVEALETTAMVIAEMIATGDLARLTRPGLELDLSRPVSFKGLSFNDGVGLGHVVLHEPRVVVTNLFNEDSDAGGAPARQGARVAAPVDRRHAVAARRRLRGRAPRRARSLPHVRQRPRLGAAAGRGGAQRPHRRSGGREGAERHAGAHAAHDRSLSARADERFRRPHQPAAQAVDGARPGDACRIAAARCHHRRPLDGRGRAARLSARQAARPGAGGRRRHQPRRHRGARHGHSRRRAGEGRRVDVGKRRRHHRRRRGRQRSSAGRQPDLEAAYAEKVRFRARRQELYRELRNKPADHQGRRRHHAADECRARRRPAAARRGGRQRHRPVPHRAAVHGRLDLSARRGAGAALPRRARRGGRQAGDLPHDRHRRRQGAALFQERHDRGEPGARLAGDPADARPARPAAHADPRAAQGGRRARAARHAADGHRAWRDRQGARDHRQGGAASVALRPPSADQPEARRHARSALAALPARRADGGGRFRLGRLQRPVPVRDGDRPRQHAAFRPLRPAVGAVPARPQADRRCRRERPARR